MEHNNVYPSGDIKISGISKIYKYLPHPEYFSYLFMVYIYCYKGILRTKASDREGGATMERGNIYPSRDNGTSGTSRIYGYPLHPKYPLHPSAIYIHLLILRNRGGVFNSNLTIILTITSSYKFTNILYYNI